MSLNAGNKRLKSVLLVYLILAITGSFAFSTGQSFSYEKINNDILGSGRNISSITHIIDWLAEDTPVISKAHKYSNTPLRSGLLRIFTLTGTIGIAMFLVKSNFSMIKNTTFLTVNYLVPLKLRI
ncbi:MAG: hypothetical protein FWG07_01015 [Treponema sp.]|nr:hypothetical protein [Treponema sp.]